MFCPHPAQTIFFQQLNNTFLEKNLFILCPDPSQNEWARRSEDNETFGIIGFPGIWDRRTPVQLLQ